MLKTCNTQDDIDLKTRLYISEAAETNEENAYYAFIILKVFRNERAPL